MNKQGLYDSQQNSRGMPTSHIDELVKLNKRYGALKTERSSWITHWTELSSFLFPISGRYFLTDRNKGWKRNSQIIDSSATRAMRTLASGMMSGMHSKTRPWFSVTTPDKDLRKVKSVKLWLSQVTEIIFLILARSNAYRVMHSMYEDLAVFGTSAAIINDNYHNIIRLRHVPIGEFCLANNQDCEVKTFFREFDKTVGQVVEEFGIDNVSNAVKSSYYNGNLDQWITVRHGIEPRTARDPKNPTSKHMAYKSVYWEAARSESTLRDSGYKDFPCLCARWDTRGEDVYGFGPGMDVLGDVKQLQLSQMRKSQAIDFQTLPPLQIPLELQGREIENFPGGFTYYDPASGGSAIKSLYDVQLNLQHLELDIEDIRRRITQGFFSDVFTMITDTSKDATAFEIAERKEEKMVLLGPVVERMNDEISRPLIETIFAKALAGGVFPTPPQELSESTLDVEYVSILAQAQKAVSNSSTDRFVSVLGQVATIKPDVLDKFDADSWVDIYSDNAGVDPEMIVSGKQLALIRQQKQDQMKQAQAMQAAETMAKVGGTKTQGTAAGDLLKQMRGQ